MSNRKKAIPNFFILIILVAGIAWVCGRFLRISNDEYTDNAQVKQHLTPVITRVQGFIKKIYFEEYQKVKKGDTLVVIEDIEYRLKVAQAEADYHNALVGKNAMYTTINTTQNNILVTDAAIDEQRIRLENAETDYKRYQELVKEEAVTPQQFDRVRTDYAATKARYEQLIRQKQSTSLVKQEQTQRLEQNEAAIKLAEAALELAKLNLSYTVILATTDGVTGRKEIHEGELVQQGQTLVTLVDGTEKWVIANYKETQTTNMHIGQKVKISVDAIPGVRFEGRISSISDATGSAYSIIPQDNSAGNFVKVEQRIPIRIEFTSENKKENLERLRAGMNVECTVEKAAVKRPRIAYYKENLPTTLCVFFSFFFALAFQFNGGVFLPTALQMSSELGYIKEDVSMAGYASFIGMTIIFPILFRLKFRFTTRSILLTVCPVLIACNLITPCIQAILL